MKLSQLTLIGKQKMRPKEKGLAPFPTGSHFARSVVAPVE